MHLNITRNVIVKRVEREVDCSLPSCIAIINYSIVLMAVQNSY